MLNPIHVTACTAFFLTIHVLTERFLVSKVNPKILSKLSVEDRIDLPEKLPSMINGIIVGLLGIYIIFIEQVFKNDVINPYPQIIDTLFSFYVGYTIYDMGVMFTKPKEDISMWIHHLVGLTGAVLMPFYRKAAFFPILFSVTEITVVPTNIVWVLQRIQMKDSRLYSQALAMRAIFFLIFRPFAAPFVVYYSLNNPGNLLAYSKTILSKYSNSMTNLLEENIINLLSWEEKYEILKTNLSQIPAIISILSFTFVLILGLLNTVWSVVIVSNYLMRMIRPRTKSIKQK